MANCFALKTTGDGNCLYNSFSKLFSGNEDLADRIRLLSALELYQNRTLYANLSHLEEVAKHPETGNGNLEHLFTCLLQDGSLNIYDVAKNREDALTYEALQTCHAGNWAGMFNIMAIATVFNISIYSVYPEACRGIRPLLHRKIDPVSKTDSLPTLEVAIFLDKRWGFRFQKRFNVYTQSFCSLGYKQASGAQKESSRKRNALDFGKIQEDLKEDCGCYRECNSQFLNTEIVYRWRVKYHSLPQGFQQQTKLLEMYRDSWSSDCHFVEGMFICRVAWRKTLLRISKRTYSRMVERASSGVLCLANVPKTKSDTRGQICIGFMENFVKYYGDDHPENGNTYLPPGMTLKDVYDRYRDKYKDSKPLKLARFYEIWTKHFKHVKHPKCSNMAKCVVCVFAAELLKSTADPQIRETIRSDFSEHLERQREARQSYYERRDEAISNLDVTSIIVDGMDQAKTHIPHFRDMPKNLDPKNLLQSHITGIITHGKGTKIYLDVFVNFLMVGHTHEDIDQRFSLISRRLKRKPTRSIPEFAEEVQQSMDKISVKGVNKVYDVREWILKRNQDMFALKFKAWPKDIEWLPSGSCLELFKENKDGSQLVPQGVPQVVEPDWAKLELDLVKANLKNIKDLYARQYK
ncbi:unnamed protein product [Mytilus edulis]|uniref:DUF7869 domain-containing protein n=1 Tax=Mytilus edulis TaxID=6550 RepID=A0A8S3RF71_MYTED|nr:unnamed protein product [Mytilus edulis]